VLNVAPANNEAARLEQFKRWTNAKLDGVRCPKHRKRPRLQFSGSSLRDASITMTACCDRLIELANKAIAEVHAERAAGVHN
jgi:hypothetical protein